MTTIDYLKQVRRDVEIGHDLGAAIEMVPGEAGYSSARVQVCDAMRPHLTGGHKWITMWSATRSKAEVLAMLGRAIAAQEVKA